jgi:hypothetical protein
MTTWREVNPEDIVEGKNASMWEVVEVAWPDVTLRSTLTKKQHVGQPDPDGDVVMVVKRTTRAEAVAIVERVVGGVDLGTGPNASGEWLTPAVFVHPGVLLSHLLLFHDWTTTEDDEDVSIERLTTLHHDLHQKNVPPKVMHVHDPNYATGRT